ncbi:MAG: metal ABC transporter permease, partial [Candidatus Kerfeldbacteria bacterium]|nr:metal ABC transporter permease [Candidatus Kerfeldbacteria bacterium]
LMTAVLVAAPAVMARMLSRNLKQYAAWGTALGALLAAAGIIMTKIFIVPAGILITLTAILLFAVVLVVKEIFAKIQKYKQLGRR